MVDGTDLDKQVKELQIWLKTQPQLPQNIDKALLKRFLYAVYFDVDVCHKLMKKHFDLRNKHDHIFLKRDPADEGSQNAFNVADFLLLPGQTVEGYKLILYRLQDPNPEKFKFTDVIKAFFMAADCRQAIDVRVDERLNGEVAIFDMTGFTLRHVARTTLSSLRIYMKFVQEASPVRIKQIHVLNVPSYLDKVMTVVKPFIKSEYFKLLHFHLPDAETPYEFFPRDMLPDEYGGKGGKLCDLRDYWQTKVKQCREYLMDESRWKMKTEIRKSSIAKLEFD